MIYDERGGEMNVTNVSFARCKSSVNNFNSDARFLSLSSVRSSSCCLIRERLLVGLTDIDDDEYWEEEESSTVVVELAVDRWWSVLSKTVVYSNLRSYIEEEEEKNKHNRRLRQPV